MNNLHSFQNYVLESVVPNKLAYVFKQILGTRYLMAPGLWQRTWYGSTSDRMPLCLSVCVWDCVCAWACMCIQWAKVKPRADRNLASVLCPGVLVSEVFEELLSHQIKESYSCSFPCYQGQYHTILFLTFTANWSALKSHMSLLMYKK